MLTLGAVVLLGLFFVVPWDLPANASLVYHIVARLLEICYVSLSAIGAGYLIYGLVKADSSRIGGITLVVLTVAALLGQIFFFPLVLTFLGQLGLIGLLVVALVLAIMSIPTQS